ncbi:uncharacterized [Tachysurus ichikawai]
MSKNTSKSSAYLIRLFCFSLGDLMIRALLQPFFALDLEDPALCLRGSEELGKLSGLMTRGMFFSPRSRALAMASEMMRLAFCCLSSSDETSICCNRLGTRFSEEDECEDEDEEDEDEEEDDEELLFIGGLSSRAWLLEPLVFFGGFGRRKKDTEDAVKIFISMH